MNLLALFSEIYQACRVPGQTHRMQNFASLPMAQGRRKKLKGWEKENCRKRNRWSKHRR